MSTAHDRWLSAPYADAGEPADVTPEHIEQAETEACDDSDRLVDFLFERSMNYRAHADHLVRTCESFRAEYLRWREADVTKRAQELADADAEEARQEAQDDADEAAAEYRRDAA